MQTAFTEDQETFRATVSRFLQDKAQPAAARRLMDSPSGFDLEVWKQLSSEVGLTATHIPEENCLIKVIIYIYRLLIVPIVGYI